MDQKTADYIRGRRYLQPEDNLARIRGSEARLVWGRHRQTPPLVTVVIPAYRREHLLRQALQSALDQTGFTDYQILIVDDSALPAGEPSPTEEMIRSYDDERIIYYQNQRNLGLMDNWNMCYWLAQSPWVCTLHDDDLLTQNFLQKMAAAVTAHPEIDALFNLAHQFDGESATEEDFAQMSGPVPVQDSKLRPQRVWRQNFGFSAGRTTGSFIRRDAFVGVGGFGIDRVPGTQDIIYNDDYVLAVRLFASYNCYILPQNIYNYRTGANNGSARMRDYLPDLVQEYYMCCQISDTKNVLWRWLFHKKNKYQILSEAQRINALITSGSDRMNKEGMIDLSCLQQLCGLDSTACSPLAGRLLNAFWKGYSLVHRAWDVRKSYSIRC